MMSSSTPISCHSTRRALIERGVSADVPLVDPAAWAGSCGMIQRRCRKPRMPSTSVAATLNRTRAPQGESSCSRDVIRSEALTRPEAETSTKPKPASAEKRRRTTPVMSPSCLAMTARTMIPPIHTHTPIRCRPIEFTAALWSSPPAAWPTRAMGSSPPAASTSVRARPVRERTPNVRVVTTAAMMLTASHARPVAKSVRKDASPSV